MLASILAEWPHTNRTITFGREGSDTARSDDEIGIHSVRGGTIIGEHEVIFAGRDEVVTLGHQASSRDLFVAGALEAARFALSAEPGLYSIEEVISAK